MALRRFFIEVSYKGTHCSGFQVQSNAPTVQGILQEALHTVFKVSTTLHGSSRTDAGVHALQNFFHFDTAVSFDTFRIVHSLNALLPPDIAVKNIFEVQPDMHARFSAVARQYKYYVIRDKDPFYADTAYLYRKDIDLAKMNAAAQELFKHTDYTSFSKLHTQVFTNDCHILHSAWSLENGLLVYEVRANRFLRGMVRALVATMLKVGSGKISREQFVDIILARDCTLAYFDAPAKGLFLTRVVF